jgi:hypothetical protein
MVRRVCRISIQLTLVRTLYSQFKVACLTAAIASYSLSLLTNLHEAIRSLRNESEGRESLALNGIM